MYNGFNSFKAEMKKNFTTVVAQLRPRRKSLMQYFKEMRNAFKAAQEKYDANFKEVRNDFYAAAALEKSDANFKPHGKA
jgi:vacuolar-type H+-ATPase subunit D/Vma8